MDKNESEFDLIDIPWGNPLDIRWYKASRGLVEEIHNLAKQVYVAHSLACACDCDICKKIKEITNTPIYG